MTALQLKAAKADGYCFINDGLPTEILSFTFSFLSPPCATATHKAWKRKLRRREQGGDATNKGLSSSAPSSTLIPRWYFVMTIPLVCHKWRRVAYHPSFWERLDFKSLVFDGFADPFRAEEDMIVHEEAEEKEEAKITDVVVTASAAAGCPPLLKAGFATTFRLLRHDKRFAALSTLICNDNTFAGMPDADTEEGKRAFGELLARCGPTLTTLDLHNTTKLSPVAIAQMVRQCNALRSLTLPMWNFDIPSLIQLLPESMPALEKLQMTGSSDFPLSSKTLSELMRRTPNMKVFKPYSMDDTPLKVCGGWQLRHAMLHFLEEPGDLESIARGSGANLKKLDAESFPVSSDTMQVLGEHCPNLEWANFRLQKSEGDNAAKGWNDYWRIPHPHLTYLKICNANVSKTVIENLTASCPSLTALLFGYCDFASDDDESVQGALGSIAEKLPKLQHLEIQGWDLSHLEPEHFKAWALSPLLHLRKLNVVRVPLKDSVLAAIAAGCPNLASLNFGYAPELTSGCLTALATHCKGLISLEMGDCPRMVGGQGWIDLGRGCCQLEVLTILDDDLSSTGASSVSEEDIKHMAEAATQSCHGNGKKAPLRKLIVSGILSDATLEAIGKAYPHLRTLHALDCEERITDKGLAALVHCCTQLRSLNIRGSHRVTTQGVAALSESPVAHTLKRLVLPRTGVDRSVLGLMGRFVELRELTLPESSCPMGPLPWEDIRSLLCSVPHLRSLGLDAQHMYDLYDQAEAFRPGLNVCHPDSLGGR